MKLLGMQQGPIGATRGADVITIGVRLVESVSHSIQQTLRSFGGFLLGVFKLVFGCLIIAAFLVAGLVLRADLDE